MTCEPSARRLTSLRAFSSRKHYVSEYRLGRLHQAVLDQAPTQLEPLLFLSPHSTIEERDAHGQTPLYWAALRGDSHAVSLLLAAGADYNSTNAQGASVLTAAIRSTKTQCVQKLLENGCNVKHANADGYTSLHHSCRHSDDIEVTKALLARGADKDAKEVLGYTPLMIATFNRHHKVAKFLIDQGADLNAQARNGECALHHAIMAGDHPTARYLLERGADYQLRTKAGETFLHYTARKTGDQEMVSMLQSFSLGNTKSTHKVRSDCSSALQVAATLPGCNHKWLEMFMALIHTFADEYSSEGPTRG